MSAVGQEERPAVALFPSIPVKLFHAVKKKGVSCSGYMLYLGVDKVYEDVPHHNIIFSPDYKNNVEEIAEKLVLSEEPSIYIQNASTTDPTLAPEGHSTIYILVPIAPVPHSQKEQRKGHPRAVS